MATIRFFAAAKAAMGTDSQTVAGQTVEQALTEVLTGADVTVRSVFDRSSLLLNSVSCTDKTTALRDGDVLDVLPPFAGG